MLFGEVDGGASYAAIITAFVAAFGGLAALVSWIVRKLLDQTIPGQQRAFEATITAVLATAAQDAKESRTLFREQVVAERLACEERMREVLVALERAHEEQMGVVDRQGRERSEAMQMLRAVYAKLTTSTSLAAVVTSADDAIWTKTIDGVITSWNRAAHNLLGWHPGEVIGQSVYRIVPPDQHDQERELLERLKRGERVERHETERFHRDGRRVRLEVSISPVRDATGKVVSVGTIAREVP